ncbi:MAG: hypothetical protein WDZ51_01015 [Pirellulaceae bacterium]
MLTCGVLTSPALAQLEEEPSAEVETAVENTVEAPEPEAEPPISIETSRDFFELLDLTDSYLEMLQDDRPLDEQEEEAILRILNRTKRVPPERISQWLELETPWAELAQTPGPFRLRYFLLTGHVQSIEVRDLIPEAAELFEFDHYYELTLQLDEEEGPTTPVTLVVRELPLRWQKARERGLDLSGQRVSAAALFMKTTHAEDQEPSYAFATARLSWHPEEPHEALGVVADHTLWAERGMDVAEFDKVRDRVEFSPLEREAFYQLMGAVRQGEVPADRPTIRLDVAELLSNSAHPEGQLLSELELLRGQQMTVEGRVWRVAKILIEDDDIERRLGIDHYFEITMFVRLETPIVSQRGDDETTRKQFRDEYPVLACVTELPPGVEVGENLRLQGRITGPFFKLWAYRSGYMSAEDRSRRQISPLLIAHRLTLTDGPAAPPVDEFAWKLLLMILAIGVVGVAFGVVMARGAKRRR